MTDAIILICFGAAGISRGPPPNAGFADVLIFLGIVFSLASWIEWIVVRRSGRNHSFVPLVGGLPLGIGVAMATKSVLLGMAASLFDPGTLATVLGLPFLFRELWRYSRFNLEEQLIARETQTVVRIRLYRHGVFQLNIDFLNRAEIRTLGLLAGFGGQWRVADNGGLLLSLHKQSTMLLEPTENGYIVKDEEFSSSLKLAIPLQGLRFERTGARG